MPLNNLILDMFPLDSILDVLTFFSCICPLESDAFINVSISSLVGLLSANVHAHSQCTSNSMSFFNTILYVTTLTFNHLLIIKCLIFYSKLF